MAILGERMVAVQAVGALIVFTGITGAVLGGRR
jgi:hypothetical protein